MKKGLLLILAFTFVYSSLDAAVRLKDIARVEGIRENQLVGYGIVVGLNGTGDKDQTQVHVQALADQIANLDKEMNTSNMKVKNTAAVLITATLPPFAKDGQLIDVTVSSIGDAKSLEGGTLIATVLKGVDGMVYAVAQGPVSIGGMNASSGGSSVTKNHPTVGKIPNGATVEGDLGFQMDNSEINLFFNVFSLDNVVNAKNIINNFMGAEIAYVVSPSNVTVAIPDELRGRYYDFLNSVLNLEIQPENIAKIVLDEKTGTIVIGADVRISTVAVAHGNLTITISNTVEVSQPAPLSGGTTVVTQQPQVSAAEENAKLIVVPAGVTVSDLVKALNAIGVSPRDLMSILQAINASGALHAKLEII